MYKKDWQFYTSQLNFLALRSEGGQIVLNRKFFWNESLTLFYVDSSYVVHERVDCKRDWAEGAFKKRLLLDITVYE